MNNTDEQVADDNRKKDYTSAGSATHSLYCRLPLPALLPDSIKETVGISRNVREFNPDPMRAVWMSALFPGLGQVYNRRYWKLPLVAAGFLGLGYGAS